MKPNRWNVSSFSKIAEIKWQKRIQANFETMDDYIAHQPKEAAPDAAEILNYKVPAFTLVPGGQRDQQIMMAGYAKFVGFYPFPTTMAAFSDELKD